MGRLSDKLTGEERVAKVVLDRIRVPLNGTVKLHSLTPNHNLHSSNPLAKLNYERRTIKVEEESPRVSARLKNRKKKFSVKQLLAGLRDDSPERVRVQTKAKSPPPPRPPPPPPRPPPTPTAAPPPPQAKVETPISQKKKSEAVLSVELEVGPEITVTRVKSRKGVARAVKVESKESQEGPPPLVRIKKILRGGVERPQFKGMVVGGPPPPPATPPSQPPLSQPSTPATRDEVLIRRVETGRRTAGPAVHRKDVVTITQRPKKRPPSPTYISPTQPDTDKVEEEEMEESPTTPRKSVGKKSAKVTPLARMNGREGKTTSPQARGSPHKRKPAKDTFEKYFITKRRICEHNDSLDSDSDEGTPPTPPPGSGKMFRPPTPPRDTSSIYELMSEVSLQLPAWNLHILSDTDSFCLAHVARGPVGIPVMKKLIEIDTDYNAKVYVNQTFRAEFRGVYDSYESIKKLIYEVDQL